MSSVRPCSSLVLRSHRGLSRGARPSIAVAAAANLACDRAQVEIGGLCPRNAGNSGILEGFDVPCHMRLACDEPLVWSMLGAWAASMLGDGLDEARAAGIPACLARPASSGIVGGCGITSEVREAVAATGVFLNMALPGQPCNLSWARIVLYRDIYVYVKKRRCSSG